MELLTKQVLPATHQISAKSPRLVAATQSAQTYRYRLTESWHASPRELLRKPAFRIEPVQSFATRRTERT